MTEVIRLRGIEAEGRHGAREGERDAAQPFLVDVEFEVERSADDLDQTADYRAVTEAAREVVASESFTLIETLAARIAEAVAAMAGVRSCRVVVHKPRAAERLGAGDVAAEAEVAARRPAQ